MNTQIADPSRVLPLLEALPYIHRYAGQTFVIKYGGSAMEDESVVRNMLQDVVFLAAVGIRPVVIHGGGKAITSRMKEAGVAARFVNGLRVTDSVSIGIVEEVLNTVINPSIVHMLRGLGGKACGIRGQEVMKGHRLPPQFDGVQSIDLGFVGEVDEVSLEVILAAQDRGEVPVISPVASGVNGEALNINADIAAGNVAGRLGALKMMYLSDVPGILSDPADPDSVLSTVDRGRIEELVRTGVLSGGMLPKVESALNALRRGVSKVHFIDGRVPHALLIDVFTDQGLGTEIVG
jgi:acetylglutamate kinase